MDVILIVLIEIMEVFYQINFLPSKI